MSTTPATTSYTDDQLQTAIDAAFPLAGASYLANLDTSPEASHWPAEAPNRLAIGKAFLAALPKPEADPYARLKAYAEAGARIRLISTDFDEESKWYQKPQKFAFVRPYSEYEVHPDDLHLCPEYAPPRASRPLPAQVNAEPMESWANADNAKAFEQFQTELEAVWEGKPTDGPPWIPHDGGPCPLKTEEVEEWELRFRDGDIRRVPGNPKAWRWRHRKEAGDIIAYRVLKWKPGYGPQAAQYHMPKLPNPLVPPWTPQPGDVVRLRSGGPSMTVLYVNDGDKVKTTWFDGRAPFEAIFPVISLTPAKEGQP